jgi:hypothetical protein
MQQTEPYAVPLPEKLQPEGPWNVYRCVNQLILLHVCMIVVSQRLWLSRCATSTRKLLCNFEAPDQDVFTLYDNWETAVARFPHVSYVWHESDSVRGVSCLSAAMCAPQRTPCSMVECMRAAAAAAAAAAAVAAAEAVAVAAESAAARCAALLAGGQHPRSCSCTAEHLVLCSVRKRAVAVVAAIMAASLDGSLAGTAACSACFSGIPIGQRKSTVLC